MNYNHWHVGMKLVCINDRIKVTVTEWRWFGLRSDTRSIIHNLNKGDIYTVTEIAKVRTADGNDMIGVFVAEAQFYDLPMRLPFPAALFRELRERKTDISVFTAMLNGERVPEKA